MEPKLNFEVRQALSLLVLFWVMSKYQHLTRVERREISMLRKRGYSIAEIAVELGRHRSSMYREIKRNTVSGKYVAAKADHKAYVSRKYAKYQAMRIIGDMKLREYVENGLLVKGWSPEQIAGRIAKS